MRFTQIATLLIATTIFASCATTGPLDRSVEVIGHDFSGYSEQGFLFTPESYRGEYNSIGIVSVRVWPEARKASAFEQLEGFTRERADDGSVWHVEDINTRQAIEQMYEQATEMGADALTHFSSNCIERRHGGLFISGVEISGFAIDRE